MTLDELIYMLCANCVNISPLVNTDKEAELVHGVRLTFYGKKWPEQKMILAQGDCFEEALVNAAIKLKQGRFERLSWSARPWVTSAGDAAGTFLELL